MERDRISVDRLIEKILREQKGSDNDSSLERKEKEKLPPLKDMTLEQIAERVIDDLSTRRRYWARDKTSRTIYGKEVYVRETAAPQEMYDYLEKMLKKQQFKGSSLKTISAAVNIVMMLNMIYGFATGNVYQAMVGVLLGLPSSVALGLYGSKTSEPAENIEERMLEKL